MTKKIEAPRLISLNPEILGNVVNTHIVNDVYREGYKKGFQQKEGRIESGWFAAGFSCGAIVGMLFMFFLPKIVSYIIY